MTRFDKAVFVARGGERRETRAALVVGGNWPTQGELIAVTPPLTVEQVVGGSNATWPDYATDDVATLESERSDWSWLSTLSTIGGESEEIFALQSKPRQESVRLTFHRQDGTSEWWASASAALDAATGVPDALDQEVRHLLVNALVNGHTDGYYARDDAEMLVTWATTLPGQHPLRLESVR